MNTQLAIGYLATALMGLVMGLVGAGGSIMTVPILIYLFAIPPWEATGLSLPVVGLTALGGVILAHRSRDTDYKRALLFGIPGISGVLFVRAFVRPRIPETLSLFNVSISKGSFVLALFACLMLASAISMIRGNQATQDEHDRPVENLLSLAVIGALVGGLSGLVGAGGGFLIIPALVHFARLPIKRAVNTSLLIITLQSLVGTLGEGVRILDFNWAQILTMGMTAIIGMSVGNRIRSQVPQHKLKTGFGYFILAVGSFIVWQELHRG